MIDEPRLTIRAVETFWTRIPLAKLWSSQRLGLIKDRDCIVVRVRDDAGLAGWGSVEPLPVPGHLTADEIFSAIEATLAPALVGQDGRNVGDLVARMDAILPGYLIAKSAVEMALYDLLGRASGLPVWALLGGKYRSEITFAAKVNHLPPDEMAAEARAYVAAGFRTLKVKVGGGAADDAMRVGAVRDAAGTGISIRVDANTVYDRRQAEEAMRRLEAFDLQWFEQPIAREDLAGMADLRRRLRIPVMADESVRKPEDVVAVIRAEAADVIKLSVAENGGMLKACRMMSVAGAAGIPATIGHGNTSTLSTLAEMHVAAAGANALLPCESIGLLYVDEDVVTERLDMSTGVVSIPNVPGLGATVDEAKLRYYANVAER